MNKAIRMAPSQAPKLMMSTTCWTGSGDLGVAPELHWPFLLSTTGCFAVEVPFGGFSYTAITT